MNTDFAALTKQGVAAAEKKAKTDAAQAKMREREELKPKPTGSGFPKMTSTDLRQRRDRAEAPDRAKIITQIQLYDKYFPEVAKLGGKYSAKSSVPELYTVLEAKRAHLQSGAALEKAYAGWVMGVGICEELAVRSGINVRGTTQATAAAGDDIERPLKMLMIDNGWGRMSPLSQLVTAQAMIFYQVYRLNNDPEAAAALRKHMTDPGEVPEQYRDL